MSAKKVVVKTGQPVPKSVEKKVSEAKVQQAPSTWTKIQTAEGWKRSAKKTHGKK